MSVKYTIIIVRRHHNINQREWRYFRDLCPHGCCSHGSGSFAMHWYIQHTMSCRTIKLSDETAARSVPGGAVIISFPGFVSECFSGSSAEKKARLNRYPDFLMLLLQPRLIIPYECLIIQNHILRVSMTSNCYRVSELTNTCRLVQPEKSCHSPCGVMDT